MLEKLYSDWHTLHEHEFRDIVFFVTILDEHI